MSELDAVKGKRVTAPCVQVRAGGVGLARRGWLNKWDGGAGSEGGGSGVRAAVVALHCLCDGGMTRRSGWSQASGTIVVPGCQSNNA